MSTSATSKAINRQQRRDAKRQGKGAKHGPLLHLVEDQRRPTPPRKPRQTPVAPLNDAQRRYDALMSANTLTFGLGPAGTGKTWFAAARMAERLRDREIERIIITRPAVEAGENLGFLPGELDEKYEPYFRPVRDALEEVLGKSHVEYLIQSGAIEARPLALMRGATFKNADVLLDEAQNTTPAQMKMFLTRIGEGCRVVVNGDIKQKDIPGSSGLVDAVARLSGVRSVGKVVFGREDIVRSGFVQDVIAAYEGPVTDDLVADNDDGIDYTDGLKRTLGIGNAA